MTEKEKLKKKIEGELGIVEMLEEKSKKYLTKL